MLLSLANAIMAGANANHHFSEKNAIGGWIWQGVTALFLLFFAAMADLI